MKQAEKCPRLKNIIQQNNKNLSKLHPHETMHHISVQTLESVYPEHSQVSVY